MQRLDLRGRRPWPALVLLVAVFVGVVSMHVLAFPGMAHDAAGSANSSMHAETSTSRHLDAGHGGTAPGTLMAGGICAFAVLAAAEAVRLRATESRAPFARRSVLLVGTVGGPEPPVPRSLV